MRSGDRGRRSWRRAPPATGAHPAPFPARSRRADATRKPARTRSSPPPPSSAPGKRWSARCASTTTSRTAAAMTAAAACMVPSWLATVGPGRPWSSRRRAHRARRGAGAPRSARRSPREHLSPRGSRETPRSIPAAAGPPPRPTLPPAAPRASARRTGRSRQRRCQRPRHEDGGDGRIRADGQ